MAVLTESQLRTLRFSCQGWIQILDWNMTRLNDTLLKVEGLLDTNITGLANNDVLQYDEGTGKFINVNYGFLTTTSSTTSSTSSTSSTSTTSSSTTTADWRIAAAFNQTTGSVDSGSYTDTHTDNGTRHVINETTGTPGFDFDYTFEGVPAGKMNVHLNGYYDGDVAHNVKIRAWDYNFSAWTNLTADAQDFPDESSDQEYKFFLSDTDFYSGGQVKIQFYHTSAGNATHDMLIDHLHLATTTTAP